MEEKAAEQADPFRPGAAEAFQPFLRPRPTILITPEAAVEAAVAGTEEAAVEAEVSPLRLVAEAQAAQADSPMAAAAGDPIQTEQPRIMVQAAEQAAAGQDTFIQPRLPDSIQADVSLTRIIILKTRIHTPEIRLSPTIQAILSSDTRATAISESQLSRSRQTSRLLLRRAVDTPDLNISRAAETRILIQGLFRTSQYTSV